MNSRERMKIAMQLGRPDRIPFNPQLTYPHAVKLFCKDYKKGIIRAIEDPAFRLELEFKAAQLYCSDGIRLWAPDYDKFVEEKEGDFYVYYQHNEEYLGKIDFETGNLINEKPDLIDKPSDVDKIKIPTPDDYLQHPNFHLIKEAVRKAGDDFFRIGSVPGPTMNYIMSKRGNTRGLMDLIENPGLAQKIMEAGTQIAINCALAMAEAGIDCIYLGDASSSCSLISPKQFEKYCLPAYSRFVEAVKPTGMLVYLHICGNSNPILEMMAETGVDCIEPLDPLGGVDIAEAKKRVGDRVALMGGVNTVVLANGTAEDVEAEARKCIEKGWEKGGYILAAGDMVPNNAPKKNVMKMAEVAKLYTYD